jgi:hypothetical protein
MIQKIHKSNIETCGAYEEAEALVVGFELKEGQAFRTLILQVERPDSDLRSDGYGVYSEVDGHGFYGGVEYARLLPQEAVLEVRLSLRPKSDRRTFQLAFPESLAAADREVIERFVASAATALPPIGRA